MATPVLDVERPLAGTYLFAPQVAAQLRMSARALHELVRSNAIPFVQIRPLGRLLFNADDLARWLEGAPLEAISLASGGKAVRPIDPLKEVEPGSPKPGPTQIAEPLKAARRGSS